jgi:hypothetical protein
MYTLLFAAFSLVAPLAAIAQSASAPTTADSPNDEEGIGFKSVAEALEIVKSKTGLQSQVSKPDAWIIINLPNRRQWSFTPSNHPAHPSVVRRDIKVDEQGAVSIEMKSLCEAAKPNCDKLLEDFRMLNEQLRQSIQSRIRSGTTK